MRPHAGQCLPTQAVPSNYADLLATADRRVYLSKVVPEILAQMTEPRPPGRRGAGLARLSAEVRRRQRVGDANQVTAHR